MKSRYFCAQDHIEDNWEWVHVVHLNDQEKYQLRGRFSGCDLDKTPSARTYASKTLQAPDHPYPHDFAEKKVTPKKLRMFPERSWERTPKKYTDVTPPKVKPTSKPTTKGSYCWTSDSKYERDGELCYSKFVTNLKVLLLEKKNVLVFSRSERKTS